MATSVTSPEAAGSVSTEKITYRRYDLMTTDSEGKPVSSKFSIQGETDKKDPTTKLSSNWQKLENEGYTLSSENEFVTYRLATIEGLALIVPEAAQQAYVVQRGLSPLQTSLINSIMGYMDETGPEPKPKYDGQTIDLRVGTGDNAENPDANSINEAPSRQKVSELEKLVKQLRAYGVPDDQLESVLTALAAAKASAGAEEAA